MNTKFLEKRVRKYVIAALTSPTAYLYKKPGEYEYKFFKNIEKATKFLERFDAEIFLKEYYEATGDDNLELIVIPVDVSYELIKEE